MLRNNRIWQVAGFCALWLCLCLHVGAQSLPYYIRSATDKYSFNYTQTPEPLVSVSGFTLGSFQWQQCSLPQGTYANIPGATSPAYAFSAPLAQTTYFRRYSSLFGAYSNTIRIQVVSVNFEDLNYVREHDVLIAGLSDWKAVDNLPTGQKLQTTTYLDGLGRPIEKVSRGTATPAQPGGPWGDLVQFSQYDALGRQPRQYLPYSTTTEPGKFKTLPLSGQSLYYSTRYNESVSYASTTFDGSPLNRAVTVKAPGDPWDASPGSRVSYDLNEAADNVQIFTTGYSPGDAPVALGPYAARTLLKNVHTDEKGNQVVEYTTTMGQLILTKTQKAASPSQSYDGWICTYSVYNDFGLLRYRLQPEAVKYLSQHSWSFAGTDGQQVLSELCFRYEYDDKGRTVLKKAPGAAPLFMLYDLRDRLVLMQDGNQRTGNEWTANLYDELDRTTLVALYHTAKSTASLQTDIDNALAATPVTITHPGSQADLVVSNRQPAGPLYTALSSIEFVPGFESGIGDAFTAQIDPSASAQTITTSVASYKSPVSAADLSNPGVTTIVSYDFYDAYAFSTARPFATSFDNGLAYPGGADPIQATQRTTSMQTGKMVRVLGTATFLSTTLYYDEKGRPVQTLEDNLKSGSDVTTLQYGFDGRLLSTNSKHSTAASGYSSFSVVTRNNYDLIGRITSLDKKYGSNPFKTIATHDLDDMGRLKTKHLDPGYTGSGKAEMESLDYSYNIHSQITGINKDYALKSPGYDRWAHFFGLLLGYDNRDGVFDAPQLDGHVTGALWTSQGDDAQRRYDFSYDAAGRLTAARYNERQQPGESWSHGRMDFSVLGSGAGGAIEYDLNGNLLSMLQKGVVPGSAAPQTVDELHYQYASYSNKLTKVTDLGTLGTLNGKLGDFSDGGNAADDYSYDANGNLVLDRNKKGQGVSAEQGMVVSYNFLDKPEQVVVPGKGTVLMRYDADGNKVQKVFTPVSGGAALTTTYINEYVYEDDQLRYINFEEGRLRVVQATSQNNGYDLLNIDGSMDLPGGKRGAYDYFVRDYQGNVRMIVTEEVHTGSNTCTMEPERAAGEEPLFGQVDAGGHPGGANEVRARFASSSIPGQQSGNGWQNSQIGNYVSRVGNLAGAKVGPNTLLRVMAGDQVSAQAQYYYQSAVTNTAGGSMLGQIVSSLLQAVSGSGVASGVAKGAAGGIGAQLTSSVPFGLKAEPDLNDGGGSAPKAYLTVLFFDERFEFVQEGSVSLRVQQAGSGAAALVLANIKAPRNGYAYVYVSNASDEMVYFDNVQVSQNRGRIMEENHYYAYGLKIAGISSRKLADGSEGHAENRDLYNDKELIEDADLDWYDYGFRSYDAQIGRFVQLDPLTDDYPELTPYQYAGCEPIANVDVDGLEPALAIGGDIFVNSKTIGQLAFVVQGTRAASTGSSLLGAAVSLAQNTAKVVSKSLTRDNIYKAADIITDFIPIVGGAKDIYNGIREGNGWKVALGVGSIALDVVTLGGSSIAKGSIKTVVKVGAEVLAKHELEQVAVQTARNGVKTALKVARGMAEEEKVVKRCLTKIGCFVAGTQVWSSDSTVSIEKVRKGDLVYAYDVKTGKVVKRRVLAVYERQVDGLVKIGYQGYTIYTTSEHPFYVKNSWVNAGMLQVGDSLFLGDEKKVTIDRLTAIDTVVKVYNMTVDRQSDYFVGASKVLVHNNDPCEGAAKEGGSWIYGAFKSETKWAGQLSKRGWTAEQITEAVTKGKSFDAVNLVNKSNKATRYIHPTTGRSVIIDNVTKELLHVGGSGYLY